MEYWSYGLIGLCVSVNRLLPTISKSLWLLEQWDIKTHAPFFSWADMLRTVGSTLAPLEIDLRIVTCCVCALRWDPQIVETRGSAMMRSASCFPPLKFPFIVENEFYSNKIKNHLIFSS